MLYFFFFFIRATAPNCPDVGASWRNMLLDCATSAAWRPQSYRLSLRGSEPKFAGDVELG